MIAAVQGKIIDNNINSIVIMTGGVGYRVFVTLPTLAKAHPESSIFLWIHSHIREDAFDLYGFEKQEELRLFDLILGVSGIGPKTALAILGKGVVAVEQAIHRADVAFFTGIPRLGTKNAQKIIIELKNKIGGKELDLAYGNEEQQEVIKALQSLGFERREIIKKLTTIDATLSIEEQIKQTLKLLGKQ